MTKKPKPDPLGIPWREAADVPPPPSAAEDPVAFARRWFSGLEYSRAQLNGLVILLASSGCLVYICGRADEAMHSNIYGTLGAAVAYILFKSVYKP